MNENDKKMIALIDSMDIADRMLARARNKPCANEFEFIKHEAEELYSKYVYLVQLGTVPRETFEEAFGETLPYLHRKYVTENYN